MRAFLNIFSKFYTFITGRTMYKDYTSERTAARQSARVVYEHHNRLLGCDAWELPETDTERFLEQIDLSYDVRLAIDGRQFVYKSRVYVGSKRYYYTGYFYVDGDRTSPARWFALTIR